jgi:hypothetical protein
VRKLCIIADKSRARKCEKVVRAIVRKLFIIATASVRKLLIIADKARALL